VLTQVPATALATDLSRPPTTTWTVRAAKEVNYCVRVANNLLAPDDRTLITAGGTGSRDRRRRFLVVDAAVEALYGERLRRYLRRHGAEYEIRVVKADETVKTMETVLGIVAALDDFGIDRRRDPIIAVGGGVVLDIVGLVASLYRRHTPYVRVPTTLIGLVDAGIGVKTGVNHGVHKNRLGTYEAPAETLLDRSFIATLDSRQVSNGLAEILKIGLIKDRRLFELLERHGQQMLDEKLAGRTPNAEAAVREVLSRAVHGMLEELQPNLWEHTLERLVDYGHSFSPTIEMRALPELLHGEAVCVDMALTTVIARRRGQLSVSDRDRVLAVMRRLRLPVLAPVCRVDVLVDALRDTVRHRDGQQRIPLPVGIGGAVFANDITEEELASALEELTELAVAE
jgi:3-dehydroquinate synthase